MVPLSQYHICYPQSATHNNETQNNENYDPTEAYSPTASDFSPYVGMISISNSSSKENSDTQESPFQIDNQFLKDKLKRHPLRFQFFKNFSKEEHDQLKSKWSENMRLLNKNIPFFDWFHFNIP